MLKNTPEIIAVRCPFSHSYCPPIFPLCLKLASNMSSSQTSSGNSLLPHSPADSYFLSPLNFKLTALPWSGRPPLSHCFTFSFVLLPSPHFCPLTLTHTPAAPLSLSLPRRSPPQLSVAPPHWPPALLQQAHPANPDPRLSGRPAALLTNSNA